MTDRSILVRLRADVSDYVRGMGQAAAQTKQATGNLSGWVDKNSQSISKISTTVGIVGAAMTGVAVLAVSKFAQFDQAMSNVAATGEDARGSLDALRQAALDAGAVTVYSASEAAGAIENLSKAGISSADILGGALTGSLDLAAAGQLDVADAAEIAATAMSQFNLEGEDATHVADLLAAGAGKAQGDVTDMAAALKQSGLVAAQFGLDIESTVGTLAAFANAGLLGSDAGTSFRTMLLRLGNPSKEAAQTMDDLGIAAYDAQGNFVGMSSLAEQLQSKLGPLSQEQRDAALATIFGSDAIRAANVLMKEGGAGIDEWTAKVNDQGYAAEVARIRLDNLSGDIEKLQGAFETALIGMGEGADGPLRGIVQGVTGAVDSFGELSPAAQQATLGIVGVGGLVTLGIAGLGQLVVAVSDVKRALDLLNVSGKTAGIALGGIGAVLVVATLGVANWAKSNAEAKADVDDLTSSLDSQTGAITENTKKKVANQLQDDGMFDAAKRLGLSLDVVTEAALGNVTAQAKVKAAIDETAAAEQAAAEDSSLYNAETAKNTEAARVLTDGLRIQTDKVSKSKEEWGDLAEATGESTDVAEVAAEAQSVLAGDVAAVTLAGEDATDAIQELTDALDAMNGPTLDVRQATRDFEAAIDDVTAAIEENGTTLDINTEAGRANQQALDDLAQSGADRANAILQQTGSEDQWRASLEESRVQLYNNAIQFGLTEEEANAYVDQVLAIPETAPTVAVFNSTAAEKRIAAFKALLPNGDLVITPQLRVESPYYENRADGGPITGPGGPRSDTVPAMLSPGEWVINAAAVDHYGPGFMAQVNARRYADGGQVASWSAPPPPGAAGYGAPTAMVTMDGARLTGSLDLGHGLVGVIDARVAQGMAVAARANAATRHTTGRVR